MSAQTLLTFEQFAQFHDDGLKHELLGGEHIAGPPPKTRHTRIQENLVEALRPYVRQRNIGRVHMEAGFRLSPDTWLQPDVSMVRESQIKRSDPNEYYEGSPAIAIEVASESNTAAQLDRKMEQYFAHCSEEVWVFYPETRRIRISLSGRHQPDSGGRADIAGGTRLVRAAQRSL